jgi:Tol biopolymer transport system component
VIAAGGARVPFRVSVQHGLRICVSAMALLVLGVGSGCGAAPASNGSATIVYAVGADNPSSLEGIFRIDADGSNRTRLTEAPPPAANEPLWSPTADTILFSDPRGKGEIWTIAPDGSDLRRVSEGVNASWSPDGQEIAVIDGHGRIDVLSTDGDQQRTIDLDLPTAETTYEAPAWSPDGRMLALTAYSEGPSEYSVIYAAPADGEDEAVAITPRADGTYDEGPKWSPDGKLLAFMHDSYDGTDEEIWMVRPDGLGARGVAVAASAVAWAEDGSAVIGERFADETDEVLRFPLAGGEPRLLAKGEADRVLAAGRLSPDGKRMVDVRDDGVLVVSSSDGSHPTKLTRPASYSSSVWSPDGTQIAFFVQSGHESTWRSTTHLMDADGKADEELESARNLHGPLHWSPDGTKLLALAGWEREGEIDAALVDIAKGGTHEIPNADQAAWAPDGSRFAFVVDRYGETDPAGHFAFRSTLYSARSDGADLRKIAETEGDEDVPSFNYPQWTPNGASVVVQESPGPRGEVGNGARIVQIPANGGTPRPIVNDALGEYEALAVSPDGTLVAFVGKKGIETVSLATGERNLVVDLSPRTVYGLAWAPDSAELGYLAYAGGEYDSTASLYVVEADGSRPKMISRAEESVESFDWRPGAPNE